MHNMENPIHYIEIVTPEVEKTCSLQSDAAGIEFSAPVAELGGARTAQIPGGIIMGVRAPMHETEPPAVRVYVKVKDLAKAVEEVKSAGGNVLLDGMEIPGMGKIAIYEFGGNHHGFWQTE